MFIRLMRQRIFVLFGCLIGQYTWSAIQTTPYIAVRNVPKYTHLTAMPYANPQALKGGYLTQSAEGTFNNLNAMNGKGNAVEGVNYLFDTLMSRSLDESGIMYPLLAEKVTLDPQQTKFVIFHLNPKARFSNGSALTAEDVKFSMDCFQTKSNLGLQMYLSDLARTEVLSPYQVKMTFKSGNNPTMPMVLAQMPIYSKKDWQHKDFTQISMKPILGSGPYVLDKVDAGRSIRYRRNPKYWAQNLTVNRGRYNFDYLKYVYYRNQEIAFEGFKSGQLTFFEEKSAQKWVLDYKFPAVRHHFVVQAKFRSFNPIPTKSIVLNTRRVPLNDIYFRQALSYVYDFEWQNKALFFGQYQRLQSFFSQSELEAKGLPSAQEMAILKPYLARLNAVQREGVLKNWSYPRSDGSGFNRANLLYARQLLLKAGYRYKNGLLVDSKLQPIRLTFLIHQTDNIRTVMPFIRNLQRLGIQVSLRNVDDPQYIERMRHYDFDLTLNEMPQSLNPSSEQAQLWGSQAANQPSNYNYAGIRNAVIDEVIQSVIHAKTRDQLLVQTHILDRLLRAGYYQIPMYGKGEQWFAYWNMYDQPKIKPKLNQSLDYWWSNPTQVKKVNQYLKQH